MYSIGEISKMVEISVDALRYYDQIGLLKPHHTDDNTRYRYYSGEQVKGGDDNDAEQQLMALLSEV